LIEESKQKRVEKEKRGKRRRKKGGRKKKRREKKDRRRGFYVSGRQQKWLNTATDEGAQRLRSERPWKKYALIF
jgi:hypothetical protein